MSDDASRLDMISTHWTMFDRAHHAGDAEAAAARTHLLTRYGGAVRRYLLGAVQDPDTADDLFQEFAYRFLHGDYRGASPERGRFRNFLKGVISHLVADFCNRRKRQMPGLSDDVAEPAVSSSSDDDRLFLESWRDELLVKTWESLAEIEARTGQGFHTVLRYRVDHPTLRSPELAEAVGKLLDRPMTAAAVRQLLHRAREKFGEVLKQHVSASLSTDDPEDVDRELSDLGLLHFLRSG
jgi:RNA polymerase sigma-70 factor (ECF subfamily)